MRAVRSLSWIAAVGLIVGCAAGTGAERPQTTFTIPEMPTSAERPRPNRSEPGQAPVPASTIPASSVRVGASSRSLLPTTGGNRDYLSEAPGWSDIAPDEPGVFLAGWDQGAVTVTGEAVEAAWVHDDLRIVAVVIAEPTASTVLVTADLYSIPPGAATEIARLAGPALADADLSDARIVVHATGNHHGPETIVGVNTAWADLFNQEAAGAVGEALAELRPARLVTGTGSHRFGIAAPDASLVVDPPLVVVQAIDTVTRSVVATLVHWPNDPATTLGWSPAGRFVDECAIKGWRGDECTAAGRYFTADFPGVLRERLAGQFGGETLYVAGPVEGRGSPAAADVWRIDEAHSVGDGTLAPPGALPVGGAVDFRDPNFARVQTIGDQLSGAVILLALESAEGISTEVAPVTLPSVFTTPG